VTVPPLVDPAAAAPPSTLPLTSPVIDYEPPPLPPGVCPPPSPTALHRRSARAHRALRHRPPPETPPPPDAVVFADAALRRVLEVIDRRRPLAQLRPVLAVGLLDTVIGLIRPPGVTGGTAVLRRVRVRLAEVAPDDNDDDDRIAAEVFASYTRGPRVRVIAARVERVGTGRWRLVALQVG
jgi:hypothetical protein